MNDAANNVCQLGRLKRFFGALLNDGSGDLTAVLRIAKDIGNGLRLKVVDHIGRRDAGSGPCACPVAHPWRS